ncbi:MAG TPA: hypothetical protein VIN34_10505 [Candidatus Limnocylindria bacterium]|jgi:hypothetical protein
MPARRKRARGARHIAAEGRRASHPAPRQTKAERTEALRREGYLATAARLRRLRLGVLAVGFVPLAGIVGCGTLGIAVACAVPRDWYFALWAAVIGSIVGLTIRLVLERRRFEHGTIGGS